MAAASSGTTATPPSAGRWLFGPLPDLLLGCGVGYFLSVPVLLWLTQNGTLTAWPVSAAALLGLLVSGPHYGATLLRVYEQRDDRRRYAVFTVWLTLVLFVAFAVAVHVHWLGSLLLTAYVTWSPWHFAGQNYGLSVMFLRRRKVPLPLLAKRLLYASFLLSFVISFLVIHGKGALLRFATVPQDADAAYQVLPLGIPKGVLDGLLPAVFVVYLGVLAVAVVLLLRRSTLRELAPSLLLVATQALWFIVPSLLLLWHGGMGDGLPFAAIWISTAHAAQYLWVTAYYARQAAPHSGLGGWLGRCLLAGSAVTAFPALLFAPNLLGGVPWDTGLGVLLFSVANLHHFVLDGAIWKLRDGRVARLLVQDVSTGPPGPDAAPARSWARPVLATAGAIALAVTVVDAWEREVGINRADGDLLRVKTATERLAWIGRDSPSLHTQMGRILSRRGREEAAERAFERSLAMYPTSAAWLQLGAHHERTGDWEAAARAYEQALELQPGLLQALFRGGVSWLEVGDAQRAHTLLERAARLAPHQRRVQAELRRASAALQLAADDSTS